MLSMVLKQSLNKQVTAIWYLHMYWGWQEYRIEIVHTHKGYFMLTTLRYKTKLNQRDTDANNPPLKKIDLLTTLEIHTGLRIKAHCSQGDQNWIGCRKAKSKFLYSNF